MNEAAGLALHHACCSRHVAVGQDRWVHGQGYGGVGLCGVPRPLKRVVVAAHVRLGWRAAALWRWRGTVSSLTCFEFAQLGK